MMMRECVECRRWFRDSDDTGVCPAGHEPGEEQNFIVGECPEYTRSGVTAVLDAADRVVATVQLAERQGQAIKAVRELHKPCGPDALGLFTDSCSACSIRGAGIAVQWPCPTIRILDRLVP